MYCRGSYFIGVKLAIHQGGTNVLKEWDISSKKQDKYFSQYPMSWKSQFGNVC